MSMMVGAGRFSSGGPYPKWRIRALKTAGLFGVTEVQFRTSVGGSQAATGGTAISSSVFPGSSPSYAAANAYDGSNSTEWVSSNGDAVGAWIGYQWASDIDIVEVTIRNRIAGADQVIEFAVEKYDEATSSWVLVWGDVWGAAGISGGTTFTSPKVTSKSIYSIYPTASSVSNFVSFGEIEMRTSIGGADQCSGGRSLATSQYSGAYDQSYAYNNNTGDGWASNFQGPNSAYSAYEFTSNLTIVEWVIYPRNAGLQESGTALSFRKWNYATASWTTALTASGFGAWATSTAKTFH